MNQVSGDMTSVSLLLDSVFLFHNETHFEISRQSSNFFKKNARGIQKNSSEFPEKSP